MADFKTHISTSTALGIVYGAAAHYGFGAPAGHCVIATGLCSIAGMLPDLDSNSGVPQREMLSFVSVLAPMLMMPRFSALGFTPEHMVLIAGVMYVGIRFGVGNIFRRYTKHRGMWHSIPAAMIAGMVTFLVCLSGDTGIRLLKSWAVVLGFLSHLILDEVYSVDLAGRQIRVKKSFGTALKMFGNSYLLNLMTYTKVAVLAIMIFSDDYMMECACKQQPKIENPETARDWFHNWFSHSHQSTDELGHDHGFLR